MMRPAPIPMKDLDSACPVPELRASERRDPYYSAQFSTTAHAIWLESEIARLQATAGATPVPSWLRSTHLRDDFTWTGQREMRRQMLPPLGAIHSWRTLSCDQVASFTGQAKLRSGRSPRMSQLWAHGLIDVGATPTGTGIALGEPHGMLYRPAARQGPDRFARLDGSLSVPESIAITGGTEFNGAHSADRHAVLCAEASLRVAEFLPVQAILGDALNSIDNLTNGGHGSARTDSQLCPDAVWVLNGLRICVEFTATASQSLSKKADLWAQLLEDHTLNDTGIVVLFLAVDRQDLDGRPGHSNVTLQTKKAVAKAIRKHPGGLRNWTGSRFLVADYRDYFPAANTVTSDFLDLMVDAFTGDPVSPWRSVSLLDSDTVPFTPTHGWDPMPVVRNAGALFQSPFWLRDVAEPPALWQLAVGANPPVRIDELSGKPNARPVPAASIPDRLRVLGGLG
ncbi:hypothetical protein RCH23_002120 [Cryobacterium sp. CAN_C3]|uniref:hypothetical protein n=1 Tax=unclassified Cryobacterium TaxID=2649013 RepID=UPI0018CA0D8F|nr:hypothetical protein [Cryobacterium sp. CAN_C3]MEC5154735.1 hypothetical protein [Cryobacterium sp. CAN_C3]